MVSTHSREAVAAHDAHVCGVFTDDEVGAVVNPGITFVAQAKFVLFAVTTQVATVEAAVAFQ